MVFCEPAPLKVRLFSEPPKYQSFPPLTTSYLLKVTEFFVKISQFECLVIMTEKYFCLQNIFIFLCENCTPSPPEKKSSPSVQAIPLYKVRSCEAPPPFLKICLEVQTPPPNRNRGLGERGGEHYVLPVLKWIMAPKRAKCTYFSKSKFVALEQKLMQFAQYQHTGVQTWHCGYQTYQVQYEYKKSVDIGFWVTWRADS